MLPHEFARLMLCQPFDAEQARCQRGWLENCKKRGIGTSLVANYRGENPVYTGIDLAIGTKLKHDKTVFFTFEVLPDSSRRILDVESGRYEGPTIVDMAIAKAEAYQSVADADPEAAEAACQRLLDAALYYQPPPAHTPDHLMAMWIGRERARKSLYRDAAPSVGKRRKLATQMAF